MLIPIAWFPLIVGGNAWTLRYPPVEEGEALGLFNAALAVSSVIAAFGGGLIANQFTYKMLLVAAAVSSALGVFFLVLILGKTKRDSSRSRTQ